MLPSDTRDMTVDDSVNSPVQALSESIQEFLKNMRCVETKPRKRKRLAVEPGKSVETVSDESELEQLEQPMTSPSTSSDTDEEETIVDSLEIISVLKHGKSFKNIIPVKISEEIDVDDWVLVSFEPDNFKLSCSKNSNYMYYIGQIIEKKNRTIFLGSFLRSKTTREYKGMVYGFPVVRDVCEFSTSQIVGKLERPIHYGRGLLKFNYNCK